MSTRARILALIAALLAGIGVAEVLARALRDAPPAHPRAEGRVVVRSDDPALGTELQPGGLLAIEYPATATRAARRVEMHVNAQGRRGALVEPRAAQGVVRIAALGDSHTFGHGVADDETWPAALERELAQAGQRVEVINCGVNGYEAAQVFALLERRVLALEPDLVLYAFFCNDAALGSAPAPLAPEQAEALLPEETRSAALGWLRARSVLVDVVTESVQRRAKARAWAAALARLYDERYAGWQGLRDAVRRGRALVEARGARLAVVLYPLLLPAEGELVGSAAHRSMRAFCAAEGIAVLDLEPELAGRDLDALRVHERDLHASAEAHRIAAAAIAEWLQSGALLR